jgi:predicted ATP-grasp superfamily ATP-dependent carboligase
MERAVSKEGALVIGGDYRALGVVRSLGRRGIPVWVFTNEHLLATASRYTKKVLKWPHAETEQLGYLLQLCKRHKLNSWAIFPSNDEAAAFLSRRHSELSTHFRMTTPPWQCLQWTYDKRLTHRIAFEAGVDQPKTFLPANRHEVHSLECTFPVILKPAVKQDMNAFTHAKAWRASNRSELLRLYDKACRLVDPSIIMIQEFVPGGGAEQVSYAALCYQGEVQVALTAKRLRQHPIDFGRASSFVETADIPDIDAPSRRLLKVIGLTGLVEVEYKHHPITGSYQLLDVNPRVWGWQTLAGRAGIDFPYLMWQMVHREPLPDVQARTGVRWVRMLTDLQAAVAEVCRRRLSIREYLNSLRSPLEFAVFAADDPLPALLDIPFLTWIALKRKLHSLRADEYAKNDHGDQSTEGVAVHRDHKNQRTIVDEGHHI